MEGQSKSVESSPSTFFRRNSVLTGLVLLITLLQVFCIVPHAVTAPAFSSFTVYYPLYLTRGSYLYPVKYFVPVTQTPAKASMEALIAGLPNAGGAMLINLPKDVKVLGITIRDGICTVNFSEAIRKLNVGSGGEAIVISAIVNTLSQFPGVNSVSILVEGKPAESLAGHVDISSPLVKSDTPVFQVLDDVTQHWAGGAVAALEVRDIVNGYEDGTFRPEKKVTRAEFLKMLVQGLGLADDTSMDVPFKDVSGHWALPAVRKAVSCGLVKVSDYGEYLRPDEVIPREEMAALLLNASSIYLSDHPDVQYHAVDSALVFSDLDSVQERYRTQVLESARLGLLRGFPDGTFRPKEALSRAQAATVIARMLGIKESTSIVLITPPTGFKWDGKSFSALGVASAFEANVNLRVTGTGNTKILDSFVTTTQGMGWGVFGAYVDGALLAGQSPVSFDLYLVNMENGREYSTITLPLNMK
ncbi:MAG: S-layer homology domain-containing protein [Candidatus Fermentithermobacillus carboniphilus]|uniref:S-layer homology domain-containing protein n=1 Tax=Candidatus Fermentithermobacillus carboniphilus TaxID=3085328 RepID=A0AAT9LGV4_9FIRM|nr:MAG: S-layer homology domain-containing protein [Candidatus Fermentithermobacillus carboniphilus]